MFPEKIKLIESLLPHIYNHMNFIEVYRAYIQSDLLILHIMINSMMNGNYRFKLIKVNQINDLFNPNTIPFQKTVKDAFDYYGELEENYYDDIILKMQEKVIEWI